MPKFIVQDVGEFPLDVDKLSLEEMLSLERVTGENVDKILASFNGSDNPERKRGALGMCAFLWLCMKRAGHLVDFNRMIAETDVSAVRIEWDDVEAPDPQREPPAKRARGGGSGRKTANVSQRK